MEMIMDWDIHSKPFSEEERRRIREFHHEWDSGDGVVFTKEQIETVKQAATIKAGAILISKMVGWAVVTGAAWVLIAKPWLGE